MQNVIKQLTIGGYLINTFEVKVCLKDTSDLELKFFILPPNFFNDQLIKIKHELQLQSFLGNKEAKEQLFNIELTFLLASKYQSKYKPKPPEKLFRMDGFLKRYDIEDTFFKSCNSIINEWKIILKKQLNNPIDKMQLCFESATKEKSLEECVTELFESNQNNLETEKINLAVNAFKDLIKQRDNYIQRLVSEYPTSDKQSKRTKNELLKKWQEVVWKKLYRKLFSLLGKGEITKYIKHIKLEFEKVFLSYRNKIVNKFINMLKNNTNISQNEIELIKLFYLPQETLGNKSLQELNQLLDANFLDKFITPLLIATKIYKIEAIGNHYLKNVLQRLLKIYILTVQSNRCQKRLDEKDKKRKQREKKTITLIDDMVPSPENIEQNLANKDIEEKLNRAFEIIPIKQQEICKMYFIDESKEKEIAKKMGCSQQNISKIITKIRKKDPW